MKPCCRPTDAITAAAPDALRLVGVGPKRNFTTRRWWDPITTAPTSDTITPVEDLAPWSALSGSLALWRDRSALADAVVGGEGIRAAALVYGCDLWPVLKHELRGAALVQWPWSARAMDEAGAAIDALECHTVVTYAEAGGWGRALVLEARRRGVASVGLQHGFIYRHWLNYLHEPDEMLAAGADRGFPLPDKTLLFNSYAEAHLRSAGAFPADRLEVTGSPGLDALVTRMATFSDADRAAMRALTGSTGAGQKLAVLVAKFTEVRDALPALADLMRQKPEMRLAVRRGDLWHHRPGHGGAALTDSSPFTGVAGVPGGTSPRGCGASATGEARGLGARPAAGDGRVRGHAPGGRDLRRARLPRGPLRPVLRGSDRRV